MKLRVILEPSDDGGFTAHVPALPGCISEGDTRRWRSRHMRARSTVSRKLMSGYTCPNASATRDACALMPKRV